MEKSLTSDIDLLYFSKKQLSQKYNKTQEAEQNNAIVSDEDREFYKKRVYQMTKELLRGKKINSIIDESFNEFLNVTIKHLKFVDKKDIIQKDYKDIKEKEKKLDKNFEIMDKNKLMMKDKKNKKKTIREFVNIVNKKKRPKVFLPEKKVINLKSIELKEKGIKSK
tara:strand:- start:923 stop:1420 length:498 start_codon:yes stop_codon:yes gene_type:complete